MLRKKCWTIYRNIDTKTKYLREKERGRKKFANTKLTVCRERVKKNKFLKREREKDFAKESQRENEMLVKIEKEKCNERANLKCLEKKTYNHKGSYEG